MNGLNGLFHEVAGFISKITCHAQDSRRRGYGQRSQRSQKQGEQDGLHGGVHDCILEKSRTWSTNVKVAAVLAVVWRRMAFVDLITCHSQKAFRQERPRER